MHVEFLWANLMEGAHLTDMGVDGKAILRYLPNVLDERTWTGLTWRRIGKSGRMLLIFRFLKMR
jgi:hypothetical protein